ncbi:MAG: hypothetical protein U1G08_04890 [Verrucomicrobiota bacterium]
MAQSKATTYIHPQGHQNEMGTNANLLANIGDSQSGDLRPIERLKVMRPIARILLSASVAFLPVSAAEFIGLEKLAVLDGRIPQPLTRQDIGFGRRVRFSFSTAELPTDGDSPERRERIKNSYKTLEMIKEVVKTNANQVTVDRTLLANTSVVVPGKYSRSPITSKEFWESTIKAIPFGGSIVKIQFIQAEYLGKKVIGGFESHGMKISLALTVKPDGQSSTRKASLLVEDWTTMDLPGDGSVHSIWIIEIPDLSKKTVVEERYLGPVN